jgi:hypothetical protein
MKISIFMFTSVTPVENSAGSLIVCYMSFHAINLPCFFPYFLPVLHIIEWHIEADI